MQLHAYFLFYKISQKCLTKPYFARGIFLNLPKNTPVTPKYIGGRDINLPNCSSINI